MEDDHSSARWFSHQPNVTGQGIIASYEVSEALWLRRGRLALVPSLGRGVLSIVTVGMGVSLGREAAPQMAGAAVASRVADWARLPLWQRRLLVAAGAGAGFAAVYNVPLGGAVFALEVLLGTLALPLVLPAIATSVIATAIAWVTLGTHPTYSVPNYAARPSQLVWAVVTGPLLGLAAVAWVKIIAAATAARGGVPGRRDARPRGRHRPRAREDASLRCSDGADADRGRRGHGDRAAPGRPVDLLGAAAAPSRYRPVGLGQRDRSDDPAGARRRARRGRARSRPLGPVGTHGQTFRALEPAWIAGTITAEERVCGATATGVAAWVARPPARPYSGLTNHKPGGAVTSCR